MSIEPLLRSILTAFSRLPILLILFASSACVAEEGIMNITREYSICPVEDTDEVVSTLRLEDVSSLTVTQLQEIISDTDYSLEAERYGISREACPVHEIPPDTEVLVITAWFDPTNTYFRHFYILADDTGVVTQIELRKVRLGRQFTLRVKEEVTDAACDAAAPVGAVAGVDAYFGLGATVQGGPSFDPTNGQLSLFGSVGVGAGGSTAGAVPAPAPFLGGVVDAPNGISGDVTANIAVSGPGRGFAYSQSLAGTSQGEVSATLYKNTPGGFSANVNVAAQGSIPVTPNLYDLGCDDAG